MLLREHIIAARGMLHISQAQLAEAAGVAASTIADFESGKRTLRRDSVKRIREALEQRGIVFTNGDKPSVTLDRSKAVIHV